MIVRRLVAVDAPIWRDIRLEMLEQEPLAFGSRYVDQAAQPMEAFARRLDETHQFGAFDDREQLVGTAGWVGLSEPTTSHRGVVVAVYVRPESRGAGIVETLFEALVDDAKAHVVQLELDVGATNARAFGAYRRLGFEQVGLVPRSLRHDDVYVDEIRMLLRLDG